MNVTESIKIGIKQMTEFREIFHKGLMKDHVITMSERKMTKNLETIKTFNTDLIFSLMLYLRSNFSSL